MECGSTPTYHDIDTKESSPHDWGIDDLDNVGVVVNIKVVEGMISEASPPGQMKKMKLNGFPPALTT